MKRSSLGLATVFALTALSGAACSSVPEDSASGDSASTEDVKAAREACHFKRGALPAETLGDNAPVGDKMPIKNIVVLMQENRSFDSYFGHLGKYANRDDIESAPEDTTNPSSLQSQDGPSHAYQHASHLRFVDTNHEWPGSHLQLDNGQMDGFFATNDGYSETDRLKPLADGERALWWYDERDIPFYYDLASTFAIGDHYHSSVIGPTWPNRMFFYSGTSFGLTYNTSPSSAQKKANPLMIFDELQQAHVSWAIYTDGLVPGVSTMLGLGAFGRWGEKKVFSMNAFYDLAKAGTLPQVAFVDPKLGQEGPTTNDEHPPADIQVGQKFVSDVIHSLFASPQWSKLAFFLTYDENGGIFDHVVPPKACPPDGYPVKLQDDNDTTQGAFDQLGMRVPVVVVSPYAKRAYVSHATHDHTSITRFIETKFNLPALSARDANADAMLDFFDFDKPQFVVPPELNAPAVDHDEYCFCKQTYRLPPTESPKGAEMRQGMRDLECGFLLE